MSSRLTSALTLSGFVLISVAVYADGISVGTKGEMAMSADSHAPFGVTGGHLHRSGKWMLSYRYRYMDMAGNRIDDDTVAPDAIATTRANRFFSAPMMPPTLRVVPTEMTMEMHMFGAMFAPTDWLTLIFMTGYVEKEMDHITYAGGMGTTMLGGFTTESSGIGDSKFTGLIKLFDTGKHRAHAAIGISMPTGSTDETDAILTPMGGTPSPRLPYAMQIGSGTVDVLSGFTYVGGHQQFGWGGQCAGDIRTERDNGYRWGHKHQITGWLSYQPQPFISASMRVKYQSLGRIKGIDPRIAAPVQTADPDNYGGDMVNLVFGVNLVGQRGKRIAIEAGFPLLQDLNGPQMETDFILTAGVQVTF